MSIPVDLERLRDEADARGSWAYLLTTRADGRPHAVAITPTWDGGVLVTETGRTTTANSGERPLVSLVWPPAEEGGYHLVVDADATAGDGFVRLRPTKAVLHRPAPSPDGGAGGCGSDCVPLT
jgi:hypothetical protein